MTIKEYNQKLGAVIKTMDMKQGVIMASLGIEALTMIKKRVIETGVDAKGSKYKPYSTKAMLTNCSALTSSACSTIAGSKDKRRDLNWVTIKGHRLFNLSGGYKQFREIQGRQTTHVDFSFNNDMWNDINLISKAGQHKQGIAVIGARDGHQKKVLAGNTDRRGDILDLSIKEIDYLRDEYNLETLKIFRGKGL